MSLGTANPGIAADQAEGKPMTLIQLGIFLIKGYIRRIPHNMIWTLVRGVISFMLVLSIHTYFVVVKNEGFAPDPQNPVYRLITFQAIKGDALVFWALASFLFSSLVGRIWFFGPLKLVEDFAATPAWAAKGFENSGKLAAPLLLGGIGAALTGSFLTRSPFVLGTFALGMILSFTTCGKSMWFLILSTGWSDFNRLFLNNRKISHGRVIILIIGSMLGLLLALILPFGAVGRIIAIVLCTVGIILNRRKNLSLRALAWAGLILLFQAILLQNAVVHADDGGWLEAGGNFWSWWNSPGRATAINMGLNPAFLSLLAALLGSGNLPKPPPIPDVMDYNVQGWRWFKVNGRWVLYQSDNAGNKYGTGIPQSIFAADPELFGNMVLMHTQPTCDYKPVAEKINEAMDNLGPGYTDRFSQAGWKNLSLAEKEASMRALSHIIADAAGVDPHSFTFRFFQDPSAGLNGEWHPTARILQINSNSDNFDNPLSMIQTVCHEMRHAAQGDPKAEMGGGQEYRDLITWNDDNANYKGADTDFTRYSSQLLERDADAFGRAISRAIIDQVIGNKYGP